MVNAEPCPKCGHIARAEELRHPGECPACGVYYDKYRGHQARFADTTRIASAIEPGPAGTLLERLRAAMLYLPERTDPLVFYGGALVYAASILWGLWFILQPWNAFAIGESFLHRCNLPFHEFGHVLFRPFGSWLMFLGGSLFQCLLPLLLAGYFLFRQQQPFSASICLWWCGQNFIDIAPYIGDAQAMALPLTGEWSDDTVALRAFRHDWHNILEPIGMLAYDHALGKLAKGWGSVLMMLAWGWGGLLLNIQRRRLRHI
jgi:hypothetical protein